MPRSWNLLVWKSNNDTSGAMLSEQRYVTMIFARNAFVARAHEAVQRFINSKRDASR